MVYFGDQNLKETDKHIVSVKYLQRRFCSMELDNKFGFVLACLCFKSDRNKLCFL